MRTHRIDAERDAARRFWLAAARRLCLAAGLTALAGCGSTDASPGGGSDPEDPGPPKGLSLIVPQDGLDPSLALDESDYPIVAYVREEGAQSAVFYVSWDPGAKAWRPEVLVDELGVVNSEGPRRQLSLAIDLASGERAIAYPKGSYELWLALSSDDGATWTTERVDVADGDAIAGDDPDYLVETPVVALHDGKLHLAYRHECLKALSACGSVRDSHAIVYRRRTGAGAFVDEIAPTPDGLQDVVAPPSLALDSTGAPAIVYVLGQPFDSLEAYTRTVVFWRPGSPTGVVVTDSATQQNDNPSVSLAFDGTKPRIAYHLMRASDGSEEDLWLSSSGDGVAWPEPTQIPPDGNHSTTLWQSLLIDDAGGAILAAYHRGSTGDPGGATAGGPKLFRSSDLVQWTVESPDREKLPGGAGRFVQLASTGEGKLYMTFHYEVLDNAALGAGLVLWREP